MAAFLFVQNNFIIKYLNYLDKFIYQFSSKTKK